MDGVNRRVGVRSSASAALRIEGGAPHPLGERRVVHHPAGQRLARLPQMVEQHPGVGRPVGGTPGGRRGDQGVQVGRDAVAGLAPGRLDRAGRSRNRLVHVRVGDLDRIVAGVRLGTGQQLVEHHAQGVHVAARVGLAVGDQLGRDVADRADQHAGGGRGLGTDRPGQAEVGDLDLAAVRDQHVLGLDVAMDQAGLVGGGDGAGHLDDQIEGPFRTERTLAGDQVPQRATLDVLHDDVGPAAVHPLVEHRHHVRMGEPGGGPGLAVELADEVLVVAQTFVHHLDRDGPRQSLVVGKVDRRHATPRELALDRVATVQQLPHQGVACAHSGHHRSGQVRGSRPSRPAGESRSASVHTRDDPPKVNRTASAGVSSPRPGSPPAGSLAGRTRARHRGARGGTGCPVGWAP